MPIVDRPNKEALLKAVDIFLDKMRPFFMGCLDFAPGASARIALERSLRGEQTARFFRNLHIENELESAIEISFFATITETYWEDIFSSRFGGNRNIIRKLRRITEARNRAAHPPHLRDLDDGFTQGSLCHIAYVLRRIRAWEEHAAVVRLREGLGNSTGRPSEAETNASIRFEEKVQEADAARFAAEKRARIAEATCTEAQELIQTAEILRVHAEERVSAAEAAKRKARDLAQNSESARREAERRVHSAEAAQLSADKQMRAAIEALGEMERRLKKTEDKLQFVQKQQEPSRTGLVAKEEAIRPIKNRRPIARNTPQYENWLIGEIQSGKISRSLLCQFAGDNRVDGRLLHFVQAASSDMSQTAWKNYVASRRETLARGRNTGASQPWLRPSHSRHGLSQKLSS